MSVIQSQQRDGNMYSSVTQKKFDQFVPSYGQHRFNTTTAHYYSQLEPRTTKVSPTEASVYFSKYKEYTGFRKRSMFDNSYPGGLSQKYIEEPYDIPNQPVDRKEFETTSQAFYQQVHPYEETMVTPSYRYEGRFKPDGLGFRRVSCFVPNVEQAGFARTSNLKAYHDHKL